MPKAVYIMEAESVQKISKSMDTLQAELKSTNRILRQLIAKVPRKLLTKDAVEWMKANMVGEQDRKEVERQANEAYRKYMRLQKKLGIPG